MFSSKEIRYNAIQEKYLDHIYAFGRNWLFRLVLWLFPQFFLGFAKTLIGRAHERSLIHSIPFHEMMAIAERMAKPKRTKVG